MQDGLSVDVLCGLPNYPKGEWFDGYSADGPFEEVYKGARVFRAREIPRKGNTGKTIFLNYVSWPLYAAGAFKSVCPAGTMRYSASTPSPVLMCWPAIRYAKKHHIPFTNYVLDLWPENLYSVLPVKNRFMRWVAQSVSDSLYRRCDRLIAMSGPLQERLCARTGKSTADVAVIPQYCEDFYAVPQHDAALEAQFAGRFNVVFTGTFTPAQSLDMVIRAVLDARAAGAEHLHLLLVGDGMSREALQKQAADLHAGDAVTFYGSVPAADVPRFTALADALRDAGVDVAVLANNHCCDGGSKGIRTTIRELDRHGIEHTGVFLDSSDFRARHPLRFEAGGIRFALLNYTYGTNGLPVPSGLSVNPIDTVRIAADLAAVEHRTAWICVIACMHWGNE